MHKQSAPKELSLPEKTSEVFFGAEEDLVMVNFTDIHCYACPHGNEETPSPEAEQILSAKREH